MGTAISRQIAAMTRYPVEFLGLEFHFRPENRAGLSDDKLVQDAAYCCTLQVLAHI